MAQKNTPNVTGARLRKLINEALKLRESQQKTLPPGLVPSVWPAWPYVDGSNILGSMVSREIGQPEKSQEELKWRLKQVRYPFPEGNKSGKTFYQHIQSLGLLDLLLNPPLLWEIRQVWWFQGHYGKEASSPWCNPDILIL